MSVLYQLVKRQRTSTESREKSNKQSNLTMHRSLFQAFRWWRAVRSKESDGERSEGKKAMKSRGGLVSPLPLPRFYFFAFLFTSHRSPVSERLEQATCIVTKLF